MSAGPTALTRWVWVVGLSPLLLAPDPVRVEAALLLVALGLLSRFLPRASPEVEAWRFFVGPLLSLVATLGGGLLRTALGASSAVLAWGLGASLSAVALAWPGLALLRLNGGACAQRPWRATAAALLVSVLIALRAGTTLLAAAVLVLAVWGDLGRRLYEPDGRAGWRRVVLLIGWPLVLLYSAESSSAPLARSEAPGVLEALKELFRFVWIVSGARVILSGFSHVMHGLPLRTRLLLTYFFSTLVPGLLVLLLGAVVVVAGIGTLRAGIASALIRRDLAELSSWLERGTHVDVSDTLTEALYVTGGEDATAMTLSPPEVRALVDSALPPGPGVDRGANRGGVLGVATDTTWLKIAQRGALPLPDTLVVHPGMLSGQERGSALLHIGTGRAAFVAAQRVRGSNVVRVLAKPLNREVAEGYARVVGADLIIVPTVSLVVTPQGSRLRLGSRRTKAGLSAIATSLAPGGRGLLHRPFRHGLCEILSTEDSGQPSSLHGVVVVRTTIAQLASGLFATGGLNVLVVVAEAVLGFLILAALLLSTVIGLTINHTITSSVAVLKKGAERLSGGDLDARVEPQGRGELGRLAESFNRLAADLKRLVREVADKERLDRELQIARQIQESLLPEALPALEGIDLAASSQPAREVAGDYYDAFVGGSGRLTLVVADVSGKGVAAAMLMSNLQSALHVLMAQDPPLDELVERLNGHVWRNSPPEMFITLFVGTVDPQTLVLDYVNAGHEHPIVIRGHDTLTLPPTGLVLGVFPEARYRVGRLTLQPGDVVALYSDGITEAMDPSEEEFGTARLEQALRDALGNDAACILSFVLDRVCAHTAGHATLDDQTILVLRVVGSCAAGAPCPKA